MDGLTDEPFRLVQTQVAKPDIIFTEFVSAEGLAHNAVKLYDHLLYSDIERPVIGQLFGKDPDSFYQAALILCFLGFDGIDINMGCPARTVTQHGGGAALIDKPEVAKKIVVAVKAAIADFATQKRNLNDLHLKEKTLAVIERNNKYSHYSSPSTGPQTPPTLSVKTRLGTTHSVVESWIEFLCQQQPDFLTLHGRTLKQGYAGLADWPAIRTAAQIAHQAHIRLLGNGDIKNYADGLAASREYGTDGALIGRGALGNPWVFLREPHLVTSREKFDTMYLHAQISRFTFPSRRFDYLRQQFLFYAASLPHAKKLRQNLVRVSSLDQLCALEAEFIS